MKREEIIAQQRMDRAGRFGGKLAPEEAIKIYRAIIELGDSKFQRAQVIPSKFFIHCLGKTSRLKGLCTGSGREKVFYKVHLAITNASWQQTIPLIIDDVTVNVITDERGGLDPRLSSAIEAAVKSFNLQDENPISPSQSMQTSLPVRPASQNLQSISSSNDNVTDTVDVGSTNGTMGTTSTISLVLRSGNRKGEEEAAHVNMNKRESSDSESDDEWDKVDGKECC
jgi:hypothetical protein